MNPKDMTNEALLDAWLKEMKGDYEHGCPCESEVQRRLDDADALRKENKELRKDKERLDWMDKLEPNAFYMLSLFRHADGSILVIADGSKPIREHLDYARIPKESEASHE